MQLKNWKFTALAICILLAGFGIGYLVFDVKPDTKLIEHNDHVIDGLNDQIQILINEKNELLSGREELYGEIESITKKYDEQRSETIPETVTVKNETNILSKGKKLYGESGGKNTKRAEIASYGSHAVDENVVLRRINDNQKATITIYKGITKVQDTIIQTQYLTIKEYAKTPKKKCRLWKWLAVIAIGYGATQSI